MPSKRASSEPQKRKDQEDIAITGNENEEIHDLSQNQRKRTKYDASSNVSLFIEAAMAGDVTNLAELLSAGIPIDAQDEDGLSALAAAAMYGHGTAVHYLLEKKASPLTSHEENTQRKVSMEEDAPLAAAFTLLVLSSISGNTASVQALLDAKAPIDAQNENGASALQLAATAGHADVVATLAAAGASRSLCDDRGMSALMLAAQKGRVEVLKVLLSLSKEDLELRNNDEETALICAIVAGKAEAVEVLLDAGAALYSWGDPLMLAVHYGWTDVARVLISAKAYIDHELIDEPLSPALSHAASVGNTEMVRVLLDNGADTEISDWAGRKVLGYALENRQIEVLKLLIAAGADVNAREASRNTLLMLSVKRGDIVAAELLIHARACLDERNDDAKTAIMLASERGNIGLVNLLIAAKAELEISDVNGYTALTLAVIHAHGAVVYALLRAGANANARNLRKYIPPLALTTSRPIVTILIVSQADVNVRDNHGNTPLMRAARARNLELVEILLDFHASVTEKNFSGQTASMMASASSKGRVNSALLSILHKINTSGGTLMAAQHENINCSRQADAKTDADVNTAALDLNKALKKAIDDHDVEEAQLLISKNVNLTSRDNEGYTLLGQAVKKAVENADPSIVEMLVNAGAYTSSQPLSDLKTFHRICLHDQFPVELVEKLCAAKADVNPPSFSFPMPLSAAVGNPRKIQALLASGAHVDSRDVSGQTPLMKAVMDKELESVQLLLQAKANVDVSAFDMTPMRIAVEEDFVEAATLLVAAGAQIDSGFPKDDCALIATITGDSQTTDMLTFLIDNKADVNVVKRGWTPLALAVLRGNVEAVKVLLKNGADINNEKARMCVLTAAKFCLDGDVEEMMELLVAAKADVNAVNPLNPYLTPLLREIGSGATHLKNIRLLIDAGAKIDACDVEGQTALMRAAGLGKARTTRLLLELHSKNGRQDGSEQSSISAPACGVDRGSNLRNEATTDAQDDDNEENGDNDYVGAERQYFETLYMKFLN